jgi:hypothetical protein
MAMAEINLERKRGPSAWVWVIGLIVLAILIWALFFRHSEQRAASRGSAQTVAASGAAVRVSATSGVRLAPALDIAVSRRAA